MNKYLDAERRLAELLKYSGVHLNGDKVIASKDGKWQFDIPRWTRDDAAAFQLMVEHDCYPFKEAAEGIVLIGLKWDEDVCTWDTYVYTELADHPNKATAVRYAIVMAVIAKLS